MKILKKLIPLTALAAALAVGAGLVAAQQRGEQANKATPKLNEPAPQFTLTDQNGEEVSLSDYKGKIVVLEWFNNECPYVVRWYRDGKMNDAAEKYKDRDVVWLAVNSSHNHDREHNSKIAEQWNIDRPLLADQDGRVGRAYGARTTPHMYVINKEGALVYMGAIDDDPNGRKGEEATNYVFKAIEELLNGESVSTGETRPYGCNVKYQ